MQRLTDVERIALLVRGLGEEAAGVSLDSLDAERARDVKQLLNQMESAPPDQEDIDVVLDDFATFLKFALETMNMSSDLSDYTTQAVTTKDSQSPSTNDSAPDLKIFEPSDDPLEDLRRLQPVQIAGALASEHAKTIALVLSSLDHATAASVLDLLPTDMQGAVFFSMKDDNKAPDDLIDRIARTTVERGMLIEPAKVENRDGDQKIADFVRELPKATRKRIVRELEQNDPGYAERLQKMLFIFQDILNYDNRSIQKILGQIETQTLVVALQDADDAISQRVFDNLSKRAAAALQEEMQFKQTSSEEEVMACREQIAQLIGQLDGAGEINLL